MRSIITYLALTVTAAALLADLPPRVALTLLPVNTLPGLPVGLLLNITNPSTQPQVLSDVVNLRVSTTVGTFSAVNLRRDTAIHLPSDQTEQCGHTEPCITIPPNGNRQVYIRFGTFLVQ